MSRLFIGLELPENVKRRLLQAQGEALGEGMGARWQTAEQLHLTLRFIGNADDALEQDVRNVLAHLPVAPFQIAMAGVGCFGTAHSPRALWAGVEPEAPLAALHRQVDARLADIGLEQARREFRPHVTLARLRAGAGATEGFLAAHSDLASPAFAVAQVCLFSSVPGEGGSRYQVIGRFNLKGRPQREG